MPEIGEIRKAKELVYQGTAKYSWLACPDCRKERWVALKQGLPKSIYCRTCIRKRRPTFEQGSNFKATDGYVHIWIHPDDFYHFMCGKKDNYTREHRLVMAKHLGRNLQSWEVVHHKNGVKDDNRIENLELSTRSGHNLAHSKGYSDGYQKGFADGRSKQIDELRQEIKLLQWQIRELKEKVIF